MSPQLKSIRPFIGSRDFSVSRAFYRDLGFEEVVLFPGMSLFRMGPIGFYLQSDYVKDWVDNTQVFFEVEDSGAIFQHFAALDLTARYPNIRLEPVRQFDWGSECYLHDPSGILLHFGQFAK